MPSHLKSGLDFPVVYYRGSAAAPTNRLDPAACPHLLREPSNDVGDPDASHGEQRDRVSWWCKLGFHAWHRHEARLRPGTFVSRCRKCQRVVVKHRSKGRVHDRPDVAAQAREHRSDEEPKVVPLKPRELVSTDGTPLRTVAKWRAALNRRSDQYP